MSFVAYNGVIPRKRQRFKGAERFLLLVAMAYVTIMAISMRTNSACETPNQHSGAPKIIYRRDWKGDKPTNFLIGIFTVMEDVHRRRLIRESMLGKELPSYARSKLCSLQQYQIKPDAACQVIYTFVVGGNPNAAEEWAGEGDMIMDAAKMLKHETDILYLNVRENMNGGKTPTWFDYASKQTQFDYIAKADSDALISIPSLLSYIDRDLPPGNQQSKIYGGHLNEYDECGGAGPLCDKLRGKVYMSGQFYWLSAELARYVSKPSTKAQQFIQTNNEDFDIGFKVLSYPEPVQLMTCNGAQFWIHPLKTDEEWSATFSARVVDKWLLGDNLWRNGLFEAKKDTYEQLLGNVMDLVKLPTIID
jgi:hypothetical protein